MLCHPEKSGVFNLGSNASLPLKQVVYRVKELTGFLAEPAFGALPYRPGHSLQIEGDSSRFNQAFAFQPQINIIEGLRQLVEATAGV